MFFELMSKILFEKFRQATIQLPGPGVIRWQKFFFYIIFTNEFKKHVFKTLWNNVK